MASTSYHDGSEDRNPEVIAQASTVVTANNMAAATQSPASTEISCGPDTNGLAGKACTLHLYNSRWHKYIVVCRKGDAGERVPLYFAKLSALSRGQPDVSLHAGPDASGKMVGVVKMRNTRPLHLCLGNPDNDKDAHWEDMVRLKPLNAWKYGITLVGPEGATELQWARTRDPEHGVEGWGKLNPHHRRLIDVSSGKLLAVYLDNGPRSPKKRGKLFLYEPVESELGAWILLTAIALCERDRRGGGG